MHERVRIRRPRPADDIDLWARQTAMPTDRQYPRTADMTSSGHSFGRVAVSSPASPSPSPASTAPGEIYHADGDRDNEVEMGTASTPPALLPNDDAALDAQDSADDEPDTIAMKGEGAKRQRLPVRAKIEFTATISEDAADPEKPGDFGITRFTKPTYTTRTVAPEKGVFRVKATLASDIKIKVRAKHGPDGQTDIESDSDPAITRANYSMIVFDFTPYHGSNKAPCTHFWARDLTLKHERFHAGEDEAFAKQGTEDVQKQLNHVKKIDEATLQTMLDNAPDFVLGVVNVNMGDAAETRAYDDGIKSYQARADAIKAKGDSGTYPPSPAQ
jgi:hypothetical protein